MLATEHMNCATLHKIDTCARPFKPMKYIAQAPTPVAQTSPSKPRRSSNTPCVCNNSATALASPIFPPPFPRPASHVPPQRRSEVRASAQPYTALPPALRSTSRDRISVGDRGWGGGQPRRGGWVHSRAKKATAGGSSKQPSTRDRSSHLVVGPASCARAARCRVPPTVEAGRRLGANRRLCNVGLPSVGEDHEGIIAPSVVA